MNSEKDYGEQILSEMQEAPRFVAWTIDLIKSHIGNSILEIGAGIGNNTKFLSQYCEKIIATDIKESYLTLLKKSCSESSVSTVLWDVAYPTNDLPYAPDTVFCSNVLEHISDEDKAIKNIHRVLKDNGKLILIVPQGKYLYCSLDEALHHHRRYDKEGISTVLKNNGFQIEKLYSLNKVGVIGWIWRGKIMKNKTLGKNNLKLFNFLLPIIRFVDPILPWTGLSWIIIAKKSNTRI
jgi:2-polyprenyl-3-methyl-5-hydroxy-6-metoxy-1,4-benzoquinol methylase